MKFAKTLKRKGYVSMEIDVYLHMGIMSLSKEALQRKLQLRYWKILQMSRD